MPTPNHTIHATGEDESRELRLTLTEDGSAHVVIWWGRGNRALATLNFRETELQALREWLNESLD